MTVMTKSEVIHGAGLRFEFVFDGTPLFDGWTKAEGLTAQYKTEEYWEGGNNGTAYSVPLGLTWSNLRLTRYVTAESAQLAAWFTGLGQDRGETHTAVLKALDAAGKPLAEWTLVGVRAVSWTGPTLDVAATDAATETFEFSYEGLA